MYADDTDDNDSVLGLGSVGSVATVLYQNVLAFVPNVIACDAEEQERP